MRISINKKEYSAINMVALVVSFCTALYLGFIDEGYYSFKFLLDPGNWAAIALYTGLIWVMYSLVIMSIAMVLTFTKRKQRSH
ncbi:MAG: hypothetical protein RL660_685 [Bacteroidota bacterium]|jgi:energy-coupling factor transporter transmembrane protein EcfT